MGKFNTFLRNASSTSNALSSKRIVTLIIAAHFIIASFAILFMAFYVIFYLPKGRIEKDLLLLLKEVLEYDFFIIISGLGFITMENFSTILIQKYKGNTPTTEIPENEPQN